MKISKGDLGVQHGIASINHFDLVRLVKENPLCNTKGLRWDRRDLFAKPTPAEIAAGTVWQVDLCTPANTNLATSLPQVFFNTRPRFEHIQARSQKFGAYFQS